MQIRFDNVVFSRPGFRLVLDLTLAAGKVTALIGPSGAGKSTILDLIAGFETPVSGQVLLGDHDHTNTPPAARPVSMVFQDNNLFAHLTVTRNVGLGLDPSLRLTAADKRTIARVLDEVGLADLGDRRPGQLSGGQQSRVALARALLRDRPILLLDEPFSALGPGQRKAMLDLVARTARGRDMTVLMVTHAPEDALHGADECVVVAGEKIGLPRPTIELFADPPAELRAYLG